MYYRYVVDDSKPGKSKLAWQLSEDSFAMGAVGVATSLASILADDNDGRFIELKATPELVQVLKELLFEGMHNQRLPIITPDVLKPILEFYLEKFKDIKYTLESRSSTEVIFFDGVEYYAYICSYADIPKIARTFDYIPDLKLIYFRDNHGRSKVRFLLNKETTDLRLTSFGVPIVLTTQPRSRRGVRLSWQVEHNPLMDAIPTAVDQLIVSIKQALKYTVWDSALEGEAQTWPFLRIEFGPFAIIPEIFIPEGEYENENIVGCNIILSFYEVHKYGLDRIDAGEDAIADLIDTASAIGSNSLVFDYVLKRDDGDEWDGVEDKWYERLRKLLEKAVHILDSN